MRGIVGCLGSRPAGPLLFDGLSRLEYRGYDPAGICTLDGSSLHLRKCAGRVAALRGSDVDKPRNPVNSVTVE